jgi:PAS domain S-box-containing protein
VESDQSQQAPSGLDEFPDFAAQRLASIVESSDDAIISKDLNGIIKSWNLGAERLFGYSAAEMIGQSITILIPPEFENEEPSIIGKIIKGERVDHYETIRQRKDGTRIHISLTVSPIRDRSGNIVGASKIGRNISDGKRAQEKQKLLLREMSHRIKNLFAVASGVVALSARSANSPKEMAQAVQARLAALARAHDLTLPNVEESAEPRKTSLAALVQTILAPYDTGNDRIIILGPDVQCGPGISTSFALLLHEFATNSVKYGALSSPPGNIEVKWRVDEKLHMSWVESGGPAIDLSQTNEGFGGVLIEATVASLGGTIQRDWQRSGLIIRLMVPLSRVCS